MSLQIVYITCERLLQLARKGRAFSRHSNNFEIVQETSPAAFNNVNSGNDEDTSEAKRGSSMKKSRSTSNVSSKSRYGRSKDEDGDEVSEEENEMLHPSVVKGATTKAAWVAECMASVREDGQEVNEEVKEKSTQHKVRIWSMLFPELRT